jgi:dolichol-phosphate mannosyltransferase
VRVSIVVPTYNERETIPVLLRRLGQAVGAPGWDVEAVVVDDSSPDGTAAAAAAAGAELGRVLPVVVVSRPGKAGLASAVLDGVRRGRGDVIVVMDSDLSHPPEMVPALLGPVADGADLAIGSRYLRGGGIARWSVSRRILSWGATRLARAVLGVRVRDPMSGFFACRRAMFDEVEFEGIGYKLLLEILSAGRARRIVEIPYRFEERAGGTSKLDRGEVANYVRLVGRLRARRAAARRRSRAAG